MDVLSRDAVLTVALQIAEEYDGNLTLRQLYYQLVARGHSPNSQKAYKRLGSILTACRFDGRFPLDWLIDRSRTSYTAAVRESSQVGSADRWATRTVRGLPELGLFRERWYGQRTHVSAWVEKEALSGVFEEPCTELGISWFACKGYPSVSSLHQWYQQLREAQKRTAHSIEQAVVLYFGDHDPDGWEIPRSCERNIGRLQGLQRTEHGREQARAYGWDDADEGFEDEAEMRQEGFEPIPITFERVALNMDQIEEFNPPPFPAKPSSSRYWSYVAEHDVDDAWELDALPPDVLEGIIRDGAERYFDEDIFKHHQEIIEARREELRERMCEPGWFAEAMDINAE